MFTGCYVVFVGAIGSGARAVGQGVKTARSIGQAVNAASGGRLAASPLAQKLSAAADKVEGVANTVGNVAPRVVNALK
jgi:hypothetical protein